MRQKEVFGLNINSRVPSGILCFLILSDNARAMQRTADEQLLSKHTRVLIFSRNHFEHKKRGGNLLDKEIVNCDRHV